MSVVPQPAPERPPPINDPALPLNGLVEILREAPGRALLLLDEPDMSVLSLEQGAWMPSQRFIATESEPREGD